MVLETIKPGDKCQYGFKGMWEDGIFVEFWNPQKPDTQTYTGTFSYFEINVNGVLKRGYGKHQIRRKSEHETNTEGKASNTRKVNRKNLEL